jgi:hypothetical protein
MLYRVRSKQFCILSREMLWQSWLHSVAPDLYDDLIKHLETSSGCRSNTIKMEIIQKQLEIRGMSSKMVTFLLKNYPATVEEVHEPSDLPTGPKSDILLAGASQSIFKSYNPNLLTFPQRLIFENNDVDVLYRDTLEFIRNKVSVDYLIIDNRSYIEYFKTKYAAESKVIKMNNRELYRYRQSRGLPQTSKVIKDIKDKEMKSEIQS